MSQIKAAVVTGGHSYDVEEFRELFHGLTGINAVVQHLEDFCSSPDEVRNGYDVVVLYFFPPGVPSDNSPWYAGKQASVIGDLIKGTGQGIVVLHHALIAYDEWDAWADFVRVKKPETFAYSHDEEMNIAAVDDGHYISRGIGSFTITDETYLMDGPEGSCTVLFTTDHPKNMKEVGWIRNVGSSRVFCFELGHDAAAWNCSEFKTILTRGIEWTAGRGE